MKLGEHEHIVGAWVEAPSGPGWSNRLVWVCVRDQWDGRYRVDAIQPEDQTADMVAAFPYALVSSNHLLAAVKAGVKRAKPKRKP